jgi:F0F1-type ATP synthase membrane subunit b/b'
VRTRALFASVLLALGGLLALAPAAQAQENGDEPQLSEDTEECIHLAEEADDPAACQEAPSPIMPAADEFIWGSISFLVLLFLLWKAQLADAKAEAGRIIEEARAAADAVKRDHETRLQTELAEVRARAVADIESAKVQAMADLRGEVAQLAIGAAETVVGRNLDEATQVQLVEDYINQVAAQRA